PFRLSLFGVGSGSGRNSPSGRGSTSRSLGWDCSKPRTLVLSWRELDHAPPHRHCQGGDRQRRNALAPELPQGQRVTETSLDLAWIKTNANGKPSHMARFAPAK